MKFGYLRTSTKKQNLDRQINGLRGLCDHLLIEKGVSGAAHKRPVFERLIKRLKPGDTLIVWDLDRAFRSAVDAMLTAEGLLSRGIHFQIIKMRIDTTTPQGRFTFNVWAAGYQYERDILRQRTRQGLEAARRRGVVLGRRPKLTEADIAAIRQTLNHRPDTPRKYLARQYGVSTQTLRRALLREA